MPSVNDHVKTVKTKHPHVDAILSTYWESYGDGHASIDFVLFNKKTEDLRIEKSYRPRSRYYKQGHFDSSDVIREYGVEFDDWVKNINKRKYLRW